MANATDHAAEKRALRREAQARLRSLSGHRRAEASQAIVQRLLASQEFQSAAVLHCYVSLPIEIDTQPILTQAWESGKTVCIPYQIPEQGRLGLARWSPERRLVPGPLGVMEPATLDRADDLQHGIDLVIVPGLAFDREGTRLGRGKGYYDRFLASLRFRESHNSPSQPRFLALAFQCQIFAKLPHEEWDVTVDQILTEDEAFSTFPR